MQHAGIRYLLGLAILVLSADASAVVFVTTYDNISAVSSALTRAALIFSDNSFTSTAYAFGYAGLVVGALAVLTSIGQGRVVNPVSFAIPFVLGAAMLTAIIVPKEDITLQDRVTGEIDTVVAFPAPLANVLSWLSEARDDVIDLIDTSAPPGPPMIWLYRFNANGAAFDVLMRALTKAGSLPDQYLNASIDKYIDDCLPMGLSVMGVNWDDLNSGNVEFKDLLAASAHVSIESGYFTAAAPGGIFGTCKDSWDYLGPKLDEVATQNLFQNQIYAACEDHGILTSLRAGTSSTLMTPADTQCKQLFAASVAAAVGETGAPPWGTSPANAWRWMRQLYLGNHIQDWAASAGPNGLANYYQILDRVGWAGQAMEWMPTVRASIMALAIALIPFSLLFLLTGAGSRALFFPLGMVLWVMVWEIMDAYAHTFMMEQAFRVTADAVQNQIGLVGLAQLAPDTVKMMTAFGTIRVMSAVMATSFMYVVFRFGGMAMANLASSFSQSAQQAGADAMRKTADSIQHQQWLEALNQSNATQFAAHGVGGAHNYFEAGAYQKSTATQTAAQTAAALGGAGSGSQRTGAVSGGRAAGVVTGTERAAQAENMTPTQAAAMAAAGQATAQAADGIGKDHAIDSLAEGVGDLAAASEAKTGEIAGHGRAMQTAPGGGRGPADKGYGMGVVSGYRGLAAAQVARAVAGITGQSLYDSIQGQAGANQSIALTPQQAGQTIDKLRAEGLLGNLDYELEADYRKHGMVANFGIGSQGGGMQVYSASLSRASSGRLDTSNTQDASNTRRSDVTNKTGVNTDNPGAAQDPGFQHAARANFQQQLGNALARSEGRHEAVRGVVMAMMDQRQQELGIKTGASATEATDSGIAGSVYGGVGKSDGLLFKGGVDAKASLANSRQNAGRVDSGGYLAEADRLATMAEQKYDDATNRYHMDPGQATEIITAQVEDAGRAWMRQQLSQAERSASHQSDALPHSTVGQKVIDTTQSVMDKGSEWIDDAKNLFDGD